MSCFVLLNLTAVEKSDTSMARCQTAYLGPCPILATQDLAIWGCDSIPFPGSGPGTPVKSHTWNGIVPDFEGTISVIIFIAVIVRWICWQIWVVAMLIFEFLWSKSGSLIGLRSRTQQVLKETVSLGRKLSHLMSQEGWDL